MPLIYGINAVTEALKARRVSKLVHERGAGPRVDALVARAQELRIPVETVDRRALDKATRGGVHQGVAADRASRCRPTRVEELVREVSRAGAPRRARRHRGSAERRRHSAVRRCGGRDGVVRQARHCRAARRRDGQRVGRRRQPRADRDGRQHRAGARGAEGARTSGPSASTTGHGGLRRGGLHACRPPSWSAPRARACGGWFGRRCDRLVSIPMAGEVASLNVSVAAGVALFEAAGSAGRG